MVGVLDQPGQCHKHLPSNSTVTSALRMTPAVTTRMPCWVWWAVTPEDTKEWEQRLRSWNCQPFLHSLGNGWGWSGKLSQDFIFLSPSFQCFPVNISDPEDETSLGFLFLPLPPVICRCMYHANLHIPLARQICQHEGPCRGSVVILYFLDRCFSSFIGQLRRYRLHRSFGSVPSTEPGYSEEELEYSEEEPEIICLSWYTSLLSNQWESHENPFVLELIPSRKLVKGHFSMTIGMPIIFIYKPHQKTWSFG